MALVEDGALVGPRRFDMKVYRTAGNQGNRPFSKDTVRGILTYRFYLGEIPDGDDGWLLAKHGHLIDKGLWEQA